MASESRALLSTPFRAGVTGMCRSSSMSWGCKEPSASPLPSVLLSTEPSIFQPPNLGTFSLYLSCFLCQLSLAAVTDQTLDVALMDHWSLSAI